ncbi:SDR family NAD(P)-dependent oxidoreductase [Saccharibacillus alkalitolerans]|uniref:SDR family oxidoreductase n=1 Tax=Saccharibacillus alkalitolerans TaxID=2705290 RepID=A0ABX0F5W4_9BACL|nr:SDR family oxidoreductase [Saccharibacillus alkalitolerans]NGZ76112.1 SDR family oxidoreductase [Saccharibacillus alkalitolerans]
MNAALFDLSGKTVVITGATGYLGSAMCRILAEQGATVVVTSRRAEECERLAEELRMNFGGEHLGIGLDVLSTTSINEAFDRIINIFGSVEVLINNANVSTPGRIESYTDEEWEKGIAGSLHAYYKCIRKAIPHMLSRRNGNIINIASMYGIVSPNPEIYGDSGQNNPANYGAGKAAIIQLTKYVACHYGRDGIRCNAISPGPFPNRETQKNKEFTSSLNAKTALGRIGQPEELQGIIALLASDASSYITGQNISVDGGWTAW